MRRQPVEVRMPLSFWIKWATSHLLYRCGFFHLWKHLMLRGKAVVLMYHRVLPREAIGRSWSHPAIIVTRATFERQMRLLKRHFELITLDEFESHLRAGKPFRKPSCLVTFDDGWLDTYSQARPVLREHGVPAVVFLPPAFIGTGRMFWQEYLKRLLFEAWRRAVKDESFRRRADVVLAAHRLDGILDASGSTARATVMDAVHSRKYVDEGAAKRQIQDLLDLLGEGTCADHPDDAFMSWEMVKEMARENISFGGHGVAHRLLTTLSSDEVCEEVHGSREALARALGGAVTSFSYPNGDWNEAIADVVKKACYKIAFSTEPGFTDTATNLFAIPRINIHEDVTSSEPMFLGRVLRVL